MNYPQLIEKLFKVNLFGGMKFGLTNCRMLDKALGFPSKSFPSIHIGGSNGKGSVATKIAAALQNSGKKVGLYTSPHISCFRERIKINGEMIPESSIEDILNRLFAICEKDNIPATFFELTTLLGFAYFAQEKVDVGVIEVGLGGRLDATNIILPQLSVITSISLEHTDILGNSLEMIAQEKAGIIKTGSPIITGPRVPHHVFKTIADEKKSPFITIEETFDTFEEENQAIAKKALEYLQIPSEDIAAGLLVRPTCRMETKYFHRPIILDVAHNPDGLKALVKALKHQFPNTPAQIVLGLSSNKDITLCLKALKDNFEHFHFVEAKSSRAVPARQLGEAMQKLDVPSKSISVYSKIQDAISGASQKDELIVIAGTFFIMSEVRKILGISEPQDPVDMNERG